MNQIYLPIPNELADSFEFAIFENYSFTPDQVRRSVGAFYTTFEFDNEENDDKLENDLEQFKKNFLQNQ